MPSFPTYQRSVSLSGGGTASYASDSAFGAPARAVQGLGGALQDVGSDIAAQAQKIQDSSDDSWFSKARAQTVVDWQKQQTDLEQQASGDATGYSKSATDAYRNTADGYLKTAPSDRARQMYEQWSNSYGAVVGTEAGTFQAKSQLAKRTTDLGDAMTAHSQLVASDPSQYDMARKRAMDDLEGAKQWMTPEQEIKARETVDKQLKIARAQGEIIRDPKAFLKEIGIDNPDKTGADAINDVTAKIIGVESGGNAAAANPKSSASGVGQFTDSTWIETVRKHRPDMAGLSNEELIARKGDATLGREMTRALTSDNADILTANGLPATEANLYLAHFAGSDGAIRILRADPNTPIESILGQKAVEANDFLKGKTAADTVAWAARKMGSTAPAKFASDPKFQGLDVQDILGLYQQAQSASSARDRQAQADLTAGLAQLKGAFQLGIATGDNAVTPASILASNLEPDDKASLINSWNEKHKDGITAQDALTRMGEGGAFNPYDDKDRKGVDLAYDQAVGGGSIFDQDGRAARTSMYMFSKSGILPKAASNDMRAGLLSTDPSKVAAAASWAAYADGVDHNKLMAGPNGKELATAAQTYSELTQNRGLSSEDAAKKMIEMNSPEAIAQRERLKKPAEDFLKTLSVSDVTSALDTSILPFNTPSAGLTPDQQAAVMADYSQIAQEKFLEAGGDADLAKKLALSEMTRLYGVSSLSGESVVTKFPPENYYPAVNGSFGYIRDAAMKDAQGVDPTASNINLVPTKETADDIRRGVPPRYGLMYKREDGVWDQLPGQLFSVPGEEVQSLMQKEREDRIQAARQAHDFIIKQDQAGNKALNDTVGPDWMKARASEAARERARMGLDKAASSPQPGKNFFGSLPYSGSQMGPSK